MDENRIIEVTDIYTDELAVYSRLTEGQLKNKAEPEKGLFIAESPKVIERALDAGYEPVSLLMDRRHIHTQAAHVIERTGDIPVYTSDEETLMQLTGFYLTRGVLCAMKRKVLPDFREKIRDAKRICVLEEVENPTNIGAIFRSAAALGMDAVLLTPGCSDPLYRRSVRVSMGTVFQIPWAFTAGWPEPGIPMLREMGFKTVSFALRNDSVSIDDPVLLSEEKLALILGTEGEGLKDETMAASDYTVKIPMYHGVDSLNVAAASAVAFYELGRSGK